MGVPPVDPDRLLQSIASGETPDPQGKIGSPQAKHVPELAPAFDPGGSARISATVKKRQQATALKKKGSQPAPQCLK